MLDAYTSWPTGEPLMLDELRKQLAAEFMQRTADGTLAQAATRLLAPGGIHHDWRFAGRMGFFLKGRSGSSQDVPGKADRDQTPLERRRFCNWACPHRPTTGGPRRRGLLSVEIRRRTYRRNVGRRASCPGGFTQHTRRILAQTFNNSVNRFTNSAAKRKYSRRTSAIRSRIFATNHEMKILPDHLTLSR